MSGIKSRSPLLNKPKTDLKLYEFVALDSGLQIILVSTEVLQKAKNDKVQTSNKDDSTSKCTAAAALTVQVGSFSDPIECEGLAHFLEHMVFMGSEKYPQENAYDAFITNHGGSCNAFTEWEHTTYQFDINSDHFSEGLDIFAHCFIDPLLSMSTSEREINAIDNEFKLAGNDDGSRLQEVWSLSMTDKHVARKFSWGNKHSLLNVPTSLGVDMQATTRLFHSTHYQPHNSRLVVVSPKPLDALLEDVLASFGSWRSTSTPASTTTPASSITQSTSKGASKNSQSKKKLKTSAIARVIISPAISEAVKPHLGMSPLSSTACATITRVAMVKNVHLLYLAWAFPSTYTTYRTQPALYLSHLLGHEGAGSLLSCLKSESLATGVSAGGSGNSEDNIMFSIFWVNITLTVRGLANWILVAKRVNEYIDMVRAQKPQQWIFEEAQLIARTKYDFLDEEEESELAERLSIVMAPLFGKAREDLLEANFILFEWDSAAVEDLLQRMTPDASQVYLCSSLFRASAKDSADMDDEDEEKDDDDDSDDSDDDDEDDEEDDEDDDDEDSVDRNKQREDAIQQIRGQYTGPNKWKPFADPPVIEHAKVEPRFGTHYWQQKRPKDVLAEWQISQSITSSFPLPPVPFTLPSRNPFITTNFSLVPDFGLFGQNFSDVSLVQEKCEPVPDIIVKSSGLTIWHMVDKLFPKPKIEIVLKFASPVTIQSPLEATLNDLHYRLIKDSLNETIYTAEMAELYCEISHTDSSIGVRISGFSQKATLLLRTVIETMYDPDRYVTDAIFHRQVEIADRIYQNETLKSSSTAYMSRLIALKPTKYHAKLKHKFLSDKSAVNTTAMKAYCLRFLQSMTVDVLVQGNLRALEAYSLDQILRGNGRVPISLSSTNEPQQPIVRLPIHPSAIILAVAPDNPKEKNICVEVYYQLHEYELLGYTRLELLEQLLTEPLFDSLRTKQQLGYSVSCGSRLTYGVTGFGVIVVSGSHTVAQVQDAILEFIRNVPELIRAMDMETYRNYVTSLINKKLEPPTSLSEATDINWTQIDDRKYNFYLKEEMIKILSSEALANQEMMASFAEELLTGQKRRFMIVQSSLNSPQSVCPLPASEGVSDCVVIYDPAELHVHPKTTFYPNLT